MSKFEEYRAGTGPIPETMLKWHLYGDGLDNLHGEERPVPTPGPDELLVRQDAVGLCFSDTKVISLGVNHPRMQGRDLQSDPATLGHEVAATVVKVGANRTRQFKVGDRFIVQADVFYKGVSMAYGYVISGGLAEYSIIPVPMIDGDEGCYLLPIAPGTGYAETALVEPWACVVGAYNQTHRTGIAPEGLMLVLAGPGADQADLNNLVCDGWQPSLVVAVGAMADHAVVRGLVKAGKRFDQRASVTDWAALKKDLTAAKGFDDVLVLGAVSPEDAEGAASILANHGIMNFVGDQPMSRKLSLDIGRVHYNWHHYIGTSGCDAAISYRQHRSADLVPGGAAWFIGAGGPMGQMHVQRAVMHPRPPKLVVGTDIDAIRLQSVVDRLGDTAKARGVELVTLNPKEFTPDAFNAKLRELTGGRGFDDVVSLVPVPALIEHSTGFLADGAWCNVFAGVARGTMANIDVNDIKNRAVRYIGSSGSSIADMKQTLGMVEKGELSTNASLAAIGGMQAAKEGLAGVKDGRFPGKSLVFPLIHDMPLMALSDLETHYPTVFAKLRDGRFWTKDAEEELFRQTITKE